jgi:CHAT domain-containing protein/tetratricopeptide (TPR) repeat protein
LAHKAVEVARHQHGSQSKPFAMRLFVLGKIEEEMSEYDTAEQSYDKARAILLALAGIETTDTVSVLSNIAFLYARQERYADALRVFNEVLDLRRRLLPRDHPDLATTIDGLAGVYDSMSRFDEAERLYREALEIRMHTLGPDHEDTAASRNNIAMLYKNLGRYNEARALLTEVRAVLERRLDPGHEWIAATHDNIGDLELRLWRLAEAEQAFLTGRQLRAARLPPGHSDLIASDGNLAMVYTLQERYSEAERIHRSIVAELEPRSERSGDLALALNNLGGLLKQTGRLNEAERAYRRALSIRRAIHPGDHEDVATSLNNLGAVLLEQGKDDDAGRTLEEALNMRFRIFGPDSVQATVALNNLAAVFLDRKDLAHARTYYERARTSLLGVWGREHPWTASATRNLAHVLYEQGALDSALPLFEEALATRKTLLGVDQFDTLSSFNDLGWLQFKRRNWESSQAYFASAVRGLRHRNQLRSQAAGQNESDSDRREREASRHMLVGHIRSSFEVAALRRERLAELRGTSFESAQLAETSYAARAVLQMSARLAAGSDTLGGIVRRRQDLAAEYAQLDKRLLDVLALPLAQRDVAMEARFRRRMADIEQEFTKIDAQLRQGDFRDYFNLVSPTPVPLVDVAKNLSDDQVLLLFLVTGEETLAWAIARDHEPRWTRIPLGEAEITERVGVLRCGLDKDGNWRWEEARQRWLARERRCEALRPEGLGKDERPPFHHATAYALYKELFAGLEDLIAGRHILLVTTGALTRLPIHVLVTEPPVGSDHKSTVWLAQRNAISVMPSVSALTALGRPTRASGPRRPMIGFGNPLLDGRGDNDVQHQAALRARAIRGCADALGERSKFLRSTILQLPNGTDGDPRQSMLEWLRRQPPLPETADELCDVARTLKADLADIYLGGRARKNIIREINRAHGLSGYRIVHFATHGVMVDQSRGLGQPGLVLTPPTAVVDDDDGFLSAADIVELNLDAENVILSACNTAVGGAESNEALSGLARAFIYAGTRSLLVTHWAVNSDAASRLIVKTLDGTSTGGSTAGDLARALQSAMMDFIDWGNDDQQHPAVWAPFVVVGGRNGNVAP